MRTYANRLGSSERDVNRTGPARSISTADIGDDKTVAPAGLHSEALAATRCKQDGLHDRAHCCLNSFSTGLPETWIQIPFCLHSQQPDCHSLPLAPIDQECGEDEISDLQRSG